MEIGPKGWRQDLTEFIVEISPLLGLLGILSLLLIAFAVEHHFYPR